MEHPRRWGVVLAIGMGLLVAQNQAVAGGPSEQGTKQEAKARFVSGQSHYNLNEFAEALLDFKEAYRLLPDPVFLYNLGQCERQLGHLEEAVRFYRSFLREQPKAPNRQEVVHKIDEMEAGLKTRQAEADKSVPLLAESDGMASPAGTEAEAKPAIVPSEINQPPRGSALVLPAPAVHAPALAETGVVHNLAPSLALTSEGAETGTGRIDLTTSRSTPAASASPSFYSHWWFWTAAGIVAAGAGIGIYAATGNHSAVAPASTLGTKKVF